MNLKLLTNHSYWKQGMIPGMQLITVKAIWMHFYKFALKSFNSVISQEQYD